jgi:hypothetical protein
LTPVKKIFLIKGPLKSWEQQISDLDQIQSIK